LGASDREPAAVTETNSGSDVVVGAPGFAAGFLVCGVGRRGLGRFAPFSAVVVANAARVRVLSALRAPPRAR
jgi:hypothetical protein